MLARPGRAGGLPAAGAKRGPLRLGGLITCCVVLMLATLTAGAGAAKDDLDLVSRATGAAGAKANADSFNPSISADGRFVAFESDASNLVGDDQNGSRDVFVRGPLR
jgi:hypothetical protein